MKIKQTFLTVLAALLISVLHAADASAKKPNIVVIVIDDLGFADLGFTGCKDVATPHMDSLAANGIRFTQGYVSAAICSPSRAGLMTGRYQERWGHDGNECEDVPANESTLGNRMKELGYFTGMIGKWHLGEMPEQLLPTFRGFDEVFHPAGNAIYFGAKILDSRVSRTTFTPPKDKTLYTTELNSARAAEFINQHKDNPFCLYVAFNNVHAPFDVPQKYIDRITTPIANPERKKMAAMILAADDAVGVVLQALQKNGLEDNTLIFFLNDNGSYEKYVKAGVCFSDPFKGGKSTLWEGGIRVPFVFQWKARFPKARVYDKPVVSLDILPTAIAAAGGTIKPEWKLDGVNLLPFLDGTTKGDPNPVLYWRMGNNKRAIRKGCWKMVAQGMPKSNPKPKLFNVVEDESENHDLAGQYPDKVQELLADWKQWNTQLPPPRKARGDSKEE